MTTRTTVRLTTATLLAALLLGACGGSNSTRGQQANNQQGSQQDVTPAGDIPDTQAYVVFSSPGGYSVKVPEGWAETATPSGVTFADNLNALRLEASPSSTPPDVASVRSRAVASIGPVTPGFRLEGVQPVTRSAGPGVLLRYRLDGPADPVTTKRPRLEVQRYEFFRNGVIVALTLSSPATADNTDPWRVITDSFAWHA